MKHIKVFETTSALNTWKAAHSEINPYAYFCIDSGITYYQPFINANGHAYVDLGLPSGTLWAANSLGATELGSLGGFYAWGETSTKSNYTWETYAFGTENNFTKYNESDGKRSLELVDDAAHVIMGGDWHIPTPAQIEELMYYVQTYIDYEDGSKKAYESTINGNRLWFMNGGEKYGQMDGTSISSRGQYSVSFLSNTLADGSYVNPQYFSDDGEGWGLINYSSNYSGFRYQGFQVRAVIGTLDVFNYPEVAI